jgi:hypothetical protein
MDRQQVAAGRVKLEANPSTRPGAIAFANQQGKALVELDVSKLVHRLQSQAFYDYSRFTGQGLKGPELTRAMQASFDSMSDRLIRDMARSSTATQFNHGRNVAIQELKKDLQPFVVRAEVPKDTSQCKPCETLNGKRVLIDSADYLRFQPPAFCEGRQRCRGFYVAFPAGR